jgi:hypothetical protein
VPHATRFEHRRDWIGGRRVAPGQDGGHRGQLVARDAAVHVQAVQSERGEVHDGLRVRHALLAIRAPVEVHVAADHVEPHGAFRVERGPQRVVERLQRLLDDGVSGGVEALSNARAP